MVDVLSSDSLQSDHVTVSFTLYYRCIESRRPIKNHSVDYLDPTKSDMILSSPNNIVEFGTNLVQTSSIDIMTFHESLLANTSK